jgi:SpoIID/LytB domain protein
MVLYKGKPAQAFYSSSTGGRTQNVRDVWGSSVPYLVSVDDRWSTQAKYNPTFAAWGPHARSQAQVAAAFGLKSVARLDLTRRNASGALSTAVATSPTGKQASLTAGSFVARLGLTSNWVRLTGDRSATAAKPTTTTTVVTKRSVPKGKKRLVRAFVRTTSGTPLANRKVKLTWNPKGPAKRTFVRRTNKNGAARITFSYDRPTNVKARFAGGPSYTASKQRVRVTIKR